MSITRCEMEEKRLLFVFIYFCYQKVFGKSLEKLVEIEFLILSHVCLAL